MDFSKYKKVKQDKNSTTMQSDKGHTITLVHANMPRLQVEQLKRLKMGDGGRVGLHIPTEKKMANGGDPASQDSSGTDSDTSSDTNQSPPATNITINAAPAPSAAPPAQPPPPPSPPSGVAPTAAKPVPYRNSNALPESAAQYGAHPVQFQNPEMKPSESNVAPNGTMDPGAVMRNTQTAAQNQQAIDETGAKANAVAQSGLVDALAQNSAQIANQYNEVKGHTDDYADYIRNHPIDAQNYLHSMSGGKKASTGLALLLGGMKQGSIGGDNPASTWLNNQITRDIDAQKSNQTGQKNILDAYQHLYGEGVAATAATKASLMDLYTQKANQIALQLGTPQAAVNAQKFAAAAAIEKSKALQDAAVNLNALPGQGGAAKHSQGGGGGVAPQGMAQPNGQPVQGGRNTPHAQQRAQGDYENSHIMVPNANLDMVRYQPKLKEQLPAITEQFNQARQAEKGLQALNQIYPKLRGETTKSGWLASHINPNAMGTVGAGIGGVVGALGGGALSLPLGGAAGVPGAAIGATELGLAGKAAGEGARAALGAFGGQQQVQYENDKKALAKIIAGSVAGAKLTPTAVEEMVEQLTPSNSDNDETYRQKLSILQHFIRQNVDTSLLEDPSVHLVKRPK